MKISKKSDNIIAILGIVVLILFVAPTLNSCSERATIITTKSTQPSADFIKFEIVSDVIIRDVYTDVLYVREKHSTYGAYSIYTTFPIMEADGTCLTYDEWKARGK